MTAYKKLEQRHTTNVFNKSKYQIQTSNVSVFNMFVRLYTFSMCVFNQGSRSSRQLIAKPIKCEQGSLLITKENYLFYKLDLYFKDLHFKNFKLCFSFWISAVN